MVSPVGGRFSPIIPGIPDELATVGSELDALDLLTSSLDPSNQPSSPLCPRTPVSTPVPPLERQIVFEAIGTEAEQEDVVSELRKLGAGQSVIRQSHDDFSAISPETDAKGQ